jgi:hypothetical protein
MIAPPRTVVQSSGEALLEGAAFDIGEGKRDTFTNEEHNIIIKLREKTGYSYEILITAAQE